MLPRDRYVSDPVQQYFPDFSSVSYGLHLAGYKPFYTYMMTKQQQQQWKDKLTTYLPSFLFLGALGAIIFHKRIPGLRKFPSKRARILFGILFISISFIPAIYYSINHDKQMIKKYQLNLDEFKKYRMTGDITYINKKLTIYEDL